MNLIAVVYCWTFSCFRLWIYRSQIHSIGIYWHSHPISSFFSPFFLYIHFVCIFSIALLCCVEYIKHLNQIFYFYCITQKSIAIVDCSQIAMLKIQMTGKHFLAAIFFPRRTTLQTTFNAVAICTLFTFNFTSTVEKKSNIYNHQIDCSAH